MKKTLLVIGFLISGSTFAECKTSNVYTDIDCYEKQLKADKISLNKLYSKLSTKLDDDGKMQLEKSQKTWLDYRNSQCDGLLAYFASQSMGAGSKLITLSCEAEKTKERLKELKSLDF